MGNLYISGDNLFRGKVEHCPTCGCGDRTGLALLNVRMSMMIDEFRGNWKFSPELKMRLPLSILFTGGFTGWKGTATNSGLRGQFLFAVLKHGLTHEDVHRAPKPTVRALFCVDAVGVEWAKHPPVAIEYQSGDELVLPDDNVMRLEDFLSWVGSVSDEDLRTYVRAHLQPLYEAAEERAQQFAKELAK
jgi:hypothetical protein